MRTGLVELSRTRPGRRARIAYGVSIPTALAFDERARLRALSSAAPEAAALSHDTAVRWLGLPADQREADQPPHFTVPLGVNLDRKELRVHVARLPDEDVCTVDGVHVTNGPRTFLDLAAARDRERLVVVGDAILARELATPETIADRLAAATGVRGIVVAREIAPKLDGLAQSAPESVIRLRLLDAGLPPPTLQFAIPVGPYVVHADLAWPEAKTALEYEGRQHAETDQFGLDIDRYSALASLGWLVLRAGRRDLSNSEKLVARVARTLRRRGMSF